MKKSSYNSHEIRQQEGQEQSRKICRFISEISKRLDDARSRAHAIEDLFTPGLYIQRNKFRDYCERLIFIDPLLYGRKTEELLWRKCYYDVISTAKKLKRKEFTNDEVCAIESHIDAGIGHYIHFINDLQCRYFVDFNGLIDFPLFPNVSKQSKQQVEENLKDWIELSLHRCLVYLGDLNRYKLDVCPDRDFKIAVRYYLQAASFKPEYGIPYNQLGTLASNQNQLLNAVYYYMRGLNASVCFEGTEKNLIHLFEKNTAVVNEAEGNKDGDCMKHFIAQFLSLVDSWVFNKNMPNIYHLCHQLNIDIQECLLYPKLCKNVKSEASNTETVDNDPLYPSYQKNDDILLKMVVLCLMSISKLQKTHSQQISVAVAFTLAIYSQLNQTIIKYIKENIGNLPEPTGDSDARSCDSRNGIRKCKITLRRRRKKQASCDEESDQSDPEIYDEISDLGSEISFNGSNNGESFSSLSDEPSDDEEELNIKNGRDTDTPASGSSQKTEELNGISETQPAQNPVVDNYNFIMSYLEKTKAVDLKVFLDILAERKLLSCIRILTDWLVADVEILKSCGKSTRSLLEQMVQLMNLLNAILESPRLEKETRINLEEIKTHYKKMPLPEDTLLQGTEVVWQAHKDIEWNYFKSIIPVKDETIIRITKLISYGHKIAEIEELGVSYVQDKKIFVIEPGEKDTHNNSSESVEADKTCTSPDLFAIKKYSPINGVEPKGQLMKMKHMGQLWLAAEVRALESRVRGRTAFSPYLVLDTDALIKYTFMVKHLVSSKKFIVLVPSAVVSALDDLKREKTEARDAIRWLESQFHQGNRFFRAQRPQERAPLPLIKYPKKKDKDVMLYIQIIECCHYLVQQQKADNLVTLLIGNRSILTSWDNKELSFVGLIQSAGITMELITKFYGKWKKNYRMKR